MEKPPIKRPLEHETRTLFDRQPNIFDAERDQLSQKSPSKPALSDLPPRLRNASIATSGPDLDALTDRIIRGDFDAGAVGRAFLEIVEADMKVENAVAFAAIVAKAIIARRKRLQQR
jgi:hypothetical protein